MSPVRTLVFAFALEALVASAAWADSCPHCGRLYGDPAPGDEARVYALRADHEASCPDNPANRPARGDDEGGGGWEAPREFAGYGVVTIFNKTGAKVHFQLRAVDGGSTYDYSIDAGGSHWFSKENASFAVWFDASYEEGTQERTYSLPHNTVNHEPGYRDGREYAFEEVEGGIDLRTSDGKIAELAKWEDEKAAQDAEEAARVEAERIAAAKQDEVNKGLAYHNANQWDWAVYFFKKALHYGDDPVIDEYIRQAQDAKRRWHAMVQLAAQGNAELTSYRWDEAISTYRQALENYEHDVVRRSLERAEKELAAYKYMIAANDQGKAMMEKKYHFSAALAYSVAITHAQIPDHKKKLQGYFDQAKAKMTKEEIWFLGTFNPEQREEAVQRMLQDGQAVKVPASVANGGQPAAAAGNGSAGGSAPASGNSTAAGPGKPSSLNTQDAEGKIRSAIDQGLQNLGGK